MGVSRCVQGIYRHTVEGLGRRKVPPYGEHASGLVEVRFLQRLHNGIGLMAKDVSNYSTSQLCTHSIPPPLFASEFSKGRVFKL